MYKACDVLIPHTGQEPKSRLQVHIGVAMMKHSHTSAEHQRRRATSPFKTAKEKWREASIHLDHALGKPMNCDGRPATSTALETCAHHRYMAVCVEDIGSSSRRRKKNPPVKAVFLWCVAMFWLCCCYVFLCVCYVFAMFCYVFAMCCYVFAMFLLCFAMFLVVTQHHEGGSGRN